LFERVAEAAAAAPGVVAAGGSMNPPIVGSVRADLVVSAPGSAPPPDAERISQMNTITPGWLAAYGVGIRGGRDFNAHDTLQSPPVMLVNEAFARRFAPRVAPGRDLVGTRLTVAMRISSSFDVPMGTKTIVGVVDDSVSQSVRETVAPAIYLPLAQWEWPLPVYTFYLGVRSSAGDPALVARVVGAALRGVNSDLSLRVQPLSQQIDESLASERVLAMLSGCFGVLALLLAGLGLYGVIAYAVARRRAEIGIRMAVGAMPADIVRMVLSRVSRLVRLGVLLGILVSLWSSTFITSMLYGLDSRDPATLVAAVLALSVVAGFAAWLPAWRASRIDPTYLLRQTRLQ
jgi:ABC-type antimicrobial peptide transport system permease subunit